MAVFTSFSDESTGKHQRDTFIIAGWIGPKEDWSRFFVPAWDEGVLAGPPRMPYFHMTEWRRPEWREINRITETDTNGRIDQGCIVLDQLANLHPLRIVIDAAAVRDQFSGIRVRRTRGKQFASTTYEPDYTGFLAYAWAALKYMSTEHPEMEKLDFVVEQKQTVTQYIEEFHAELPRALAALGNPELARLVGNLIPGDKDESPLQAADLLCWHCARREKLETMSPVDKARYKVIAYHKGIRIELNEKLIQKLRAAFD